MKRKGFAKCTSLILALCIILSCITFSFTVGAATVDSTKNVSVSASNSSGDNFSWDNATVYFLLTDRFKNGNTSNDHMYNRGLDKNGKVVTGIDERGTFHGGDFAGITQTIKDGYFNELGVNALWISAPYEQIHGYVVGNDSNPSFAHYSYHGYYVLDYTQTDANFGTAEEFETLVDTAHEYGLRVIIDIVMNHSGYNSIYDMNEYNFGTIKPGWEDDYFCHTKVSNSLYHSYIDYDSSAKDWANWWGADWIRCGIAGYTAGGGDDLTRSLEGLPDFKTESTATVGIPNILKTKWTSENRLSQETNKLDSYFRKTGKPRTVTNTLSYWLSSWVREYGVDGFRCDTAKHVEFASWKALKDTCVDALKEWRQSNPDKPGADWDEDFWMTGECWDHGVNKDGYYTQGGFDSMINFSTQGGGLVAQGSVKNTYNGFANAINNDDEFNVLSYLSSHDSTLTRGNLVSTGSAFLLLPGGVQIFYGDETNRPLVSGIPFDGNGGAGHSLRSDMNWDSADQTVLAHWKKVGTFRNDHISVGAGSNTDLTATSGYAFGRTYSKNGVTDKSAAVIYAGTNASVTIDVSPIWSDGQYLVNAYDQSSATVQNGKVTFNSGANGTILIQEPDGRPLMSVKGEAKFKGTQTVTVSLEDCESAKCSVDGGNKFIVKDGDTFTIGETAYDGDTITITLEGENENGSAKSTFSFEKISENGSEKPTEDSVIIRVKPYGNTVPYLYVWDDNKAELNGAWPGTKMSEKDENGNYVVTFKDITSCNAIVNLGSNKNQTSDILGISGDVTIKVTNAECTSYELEKQETPISGMPLLRQEARAVKVMTASDYTSSSWSALSALMPSADALIAQGDDADETAIDNMISQLQSAKAALKLVQPKLTYAVSGNTVIKGIAVADANITVNVGGKSYKTVSDDVTGEFTVKVDSLSSSSVIKIDAERNNVSCNTYSYSMSNGNIDNGEIPTSPILPTSPQPTSPQPTTATQPTTKPVSSGTLSVTAKSNIFPTATKTVDQEEGTVTVSYKLSANMKVINAQWKLSFDSSKLKFTAEKNVDNGVQTITPVVGKELIYYAKDGYIKGNFTNTNLCTFANNAEFVTVTFDIIGTGEAEINLDLEVLSLAYKGSDGAIVKDSIVDYSKMQDISGTKGFEKAAIKTSTEFERGVILGDTDGDGIISISDATYIMKYLVDLKTLTATQKKAADVDRNGTVSIMDATKIQQYLAEVIDEF